MIQNAIQTISALITKVEYLFTALAAAFQTAMHGLSSLTSTFSH